MTARQGGKPRGTGRRAWIAGAVVLAGALASVPDARAQGFFENLFGGFDERPAVSQRPATRGAQTSGGRWPSSDERYRNWDWFGGEQPAPSAPSTSRAPARAASKAPTPPRARLTIVRRAPAEASEDDGSGRESPARERHASAGGGSGGAFCVRMCDGRYFPLSSAVSDDSADAASTCSALCPAAKTKVFRGSDAESARASDGTRYRELPVAFAFREKVVADCSCTGHGSGGLAAIKLEADPTLQPGDMAMTQAGLVAFKGASRFPYQTADFTPVGSYARISADLRRTLAAIKPDMTAKSMPAAIPIVAQTEETSTKGAKNGRSRARSKAEQQASMN